MPPQFQYLITSAEELFIVVTKIDEKNMKISEKDELILVLEFFGLIRQFTLKLERQSMTSEDLLKENLQLRKMVAELTQKMDILEGSEKIETEDMKFWKK